MGRMEGLLREVGIRHLEARPGVSFLFVCCRAGRCRMIAGGWHGMLPTGNALAHRESVTAQAILGDGAVLRTPRAIIRQGRSRSAPHHCRCQEGACICFGALWWAVHRAHPIRPPGNGVSPRVWSARAARRPDGRSTMERATHANRARFGSASPAAPHRMGATQGRREP